MFYQIKKHAPDNLRDFTFINAYNSHSNSISKQYRDD